MPPRPEELKRAFESVQKLFEKQDWKQAMPHLDLLSRSLPASAPIFSLRASALRQLGRLGESIAAIETAIRLDPSNLQYHHTLGNVLKDCGRLDESIKKLEETYERKKDNIGCGTDWLFAMNYSSSLAPEELFAAHRGFGAYLESTIEALPPPRSRHTQAETLTVGFVSGDYCRHSISYFLLPLLRNLNKGRFRSIAYSCSAYRDKTTEEFMRTFGTWVDASGMSDIKLAERIRADAVDILFDLAGCTGGNRLGVFARKPAPVQISWLGYPNTTGLSRMDYRLVDAVTDPEGNADGLHTEKLVRVPECFLCYQGVTLSGLPAKVGGRPFTFGSFNNFAKLSPATLEAWAAILSRAPESRLLIKNVSFGDEHVQRKTRAFFKERGVAEERVVCFGRIDAEVAHLNAYGHVDLALDSFPYNGTTTTCEALWMGVPVLALRGDRHAARVSASLLSAAGLAEWIVEDVASYIDTAAAYGRRERSVPERAEIKARMLASPLCDAAGFAKRMETLLVSLASRAAGSPQAKD